MTNNVFYCQCGNTTEWKQMFSKDEDYIMCEICKQVYRVPKIQSPPTTPLPTALLPPPPTFNPMLHTQVEQKSFIRKLADRLKEKREQKEILRKKQQEENLIIESIKSEARQEAFRELKPELIKRFKEEEIKRITGQDKQDKLKKFADAFKLSDKNVDVAQLMTGKSSTQVQQQDNVLIRNDKISRMMDIGTTANNEQMDKMMKRKKKYG